MKPCIAPRIWFLQKSATAALAGAAIVFEGVPEVSTSSARCWRRLRTCRPRNHHASTTSTILVDDISSAVEHPALPQCALAQPGYLIRGRAVARRRYPIRDHARVKALLGGIGKVPVVCAATPGYIVPRIQALAMNEAARMVEEGVASRRISTSDQIRLRLSLCDHGLLEFIDWGRGDIPLLCQPLS